MLICKPPNKRGQFSESNIKSVYLNKKGDFWTTFANGRTYTFFNNNISDTDLFVKMKVPEPDPKLTIKTTDTSINDLQNKIVNQSDIYSLSNDIMNIMYRVVKKLTFCVQHKYLMAIFIKVATDIRRTLSFMKKFGNHELLLQFIEDTIFFMNGVILAYSNDTDGGDKELYKGVAIFYEYLLDNGLLIKTYKTQH